MSAKTMIGLSILEEQEAQRRANLERYGKDLEKDNKIKSQQQEIERLKNDANSVPIPSGREMDLERRVQELENIEELLSKPMKEIAQRNGAFKETYLKQQELMAQFIVSQRAFKEIAMKYGQALGKTPEQVANEAKQTEESVKNGQSEFGNNVDSETKNALGYTQKIQEKKSESQRKADQENLKDFERILENWKVVEKERELTSQDVEKIERIQNKVNELKAKLGIEKEIKLEVPKQF